MEKKSVAMEMLEELKRANKRNFIIIMLLIVLLVASNVGWLIYESQYDYSDEVIQTVTDTDLDNSYITQY